MTDLAKPTLSPELEQLNQEVARLDETVAAALNRLERQVAALQMAHSPLELAASLTEAGKSLAVALAPFFQQQHAVGTPRADTGLEPLSPPSKDDRRDDDGVPRPERFTFGRRLYQLRVERNLSVNDMCAITGVSRNTYHDYEAEKALPSTHCLAELARDGFDVNYLLTGGARSSVLR